MNVLVVGKGGREHVLAAAIARSTLLTKLYIAPGNPGTAEFGENLPAPARHEGWVALCREKQIGLVVIGPEAPLAEGLVDALEAAGIPAFGPNKAAAQLEGSKIFAKELMLKYGIPTARAQWFKSPEQAREALRRATYPVVIKADGLAAGKGVRICDGLEDALAAVDDWMVQRKLGEAGARILVEEKLKGREVSVLAVTDGQTLLMFPPARDHKTIFDRGRGPNTGGMGAYSPVPDIGPALLARIEKRILIQALHAMTRNGTPFKGVLYAGLMVDRDEAKVLEFNVRFGDPEAQALLIRLKSDFLAMLKLAVEKKLSDYAPSFDERASVCVVLSSEGYPGPIVEGVELPPLEAPGCFVFQAGTRRDGERLVTAGGRVLGVTALGHGLEQARQIAYGGVQQVSFPGCHYRRDIGQGAGG